MITREGKAAGQAALAYAGVWLSLYVARYSALALIGVLGCLAAAIYYAIVAIDHQP